MMFGLNVSVEAENEELAGAEGFDGDGFTCIFDGNAIPGMKGFPKETDFTFDDLKPGVRSLFRGRDLHRGVRFGFPEIDFGILPDRCGLVATVT